MTLSVPVLALHALYAAMLPAQTVPQEGAAPQDAVPNVVAERLLDGEELRLDGTLDEVVWQRAVPIQEFFQKEPIEAGVPSEESEIRIAYDSDNLYIGAMLYDSEPDGVIGVQRQRDGGLASDDRFVWILDTFLDGRTGYYFETNPAGMMGDGLIQPGVFAPTINKSWNGIWEARVAEGDYGWSAEIVIPFGTLNFNPELDTWGINFQRTVRRKNEEIVWSGPLRQQNLSSPIHAGRLNGLEGISQGAGLEVKPFLTSNWRSEVGNSETGADVGLDMSYSITPSLRGSLTINTDFAEVEVDQRRVNLTRFPISYPERRDFFLEGSGVFLFSPGSTVQPFFSRRIGLVGGEPVPIRVGARVAGQIGANDVAAIQVRTAASGVDPAEDFTAFRVVRNFLRESSLGFIYTRRAPAGGSDDSGFGAQTFGSDLDLATSTFRGDNNLSFRAYFVGHTREPGDTTSPLLERSAWGLRIGFPNDPWNGYVSYRRFGDVFDPAVGFTSRTGFHRLNPQVQYTPRLVDHPYIRQLDFNFQFQLLTDTDYDLQTFVLNFPLPTLYLHTNDQIGFGGSWTLEDITEDYEISDGVVIPADRYTFTDLSLSLSATGQRRISGNVSLSGGQFWSGTRAQLQTGLNVRITPAVEVGADVDYNDVRLDQGDFNATLFRFNAGWNASPWTSFIANLQYDDISRIVGLYSRLRWIVRPGNDVFLVYTRNWLDAPGDFSTINQGAAFKVSYTRRF